MAKKKKVENKTRLMEMAEDVFWNEFNERDYEEDRYVVLNAKTGEVVVKSARLTTEKKRVKV